MTDDWRRNYVLGEDDINSIADYVTSADPCAMHIPNGSVASLIAMLRDAEAERDAAHADRVSRELEDRHIDRVLAMLVMRHGGRVEFSAAEMVEAPAHGEFVCFEELRTKAMVLAFQAREEAL